jgi:hypothetical protein
MWEIPMRIPPRARVAGALVCLLVLGAAKCSVAQLPTHSGTPILDFAGDSITVQSSDDINAHYSATYDVGINATVGNDVYLEANNIAAQAADPPSIEVINLGTNDAARITNGTSELGEPQATLAHTTAALDAFNAEFPSSTCVIFVTVNTHNPTWGPDAAQSINDHIRSTFTNIVDWDAAWSATYFDGTDNPHPNEVGRQALLALEDQAIASCPSTTTTTTTSTTTTTTTTEPTTTTSTPDTTTTDPTTTTSTPDTTTTDPTTTSTPTG